MKDMKNKILSLLMLGLMVFSGMAGLSINVHAAESNPNVADTRFSFDNRNTSANGAIRRKYNNSKVYVYPTAGPQIRYQVYGCKSEKGASASYQSNIVTIPMGTQGSITNKVNENGYTYAFIKFSRNSIAYVTTSGWWSPDSTKNYVIFN